MKKLRIAVWHNLPSGGGKRQLYNHVKGLVKRGHYVESWCPETADQKYLPLGTMIKENIIPFKAKSYFNDIIKPTAAVKDLISALNEHCRICADQISKKDFDILLANGCLYFRTSPIAKYVALPSAIYLNEPYRWFYEALPELPWVAPGSIFRSPLSLTFIRGYIVKQKRMQGMRLQAREELENAKRFDLILANSVYSRESILKAYNLESKVCYLGVDTDYYMPTGEPKENFVVGLGTIYHAKGIDRAIRALGTIQKEKRPDLIWIGNGASEHDLKKYGIMAKELGVNFVPKIHIPDNEVISLLSRALVMIYTSRLEPFGLAPLEANACGTPVVGIAEGGIKETVKDGVNGFLTNDDDSVKLGMSVAKFLYNPQLCREMGAAAREHVKTYWNISLCTDNIEEHLVRLSLSRAGLAKKVLSGCTSVGDLSTTNDIRMGIDELLIRKDRLRIDGWAFIDDGEGASESDFIVITDNGRGLKSIRPAKQLRRDVTEYFGNSANYDESGFIVDEKIEMAEKLEIGLLIIRKDEKIAFIKIET